LAIAYERGRRAYRVIKSFIDSGQCRRRLLLDHFGDREAGRPLSRCCDVCDPQDWLPDPETIEVRRSPKSASPPPDLSPTDAPLFEALRTWRKETAGEKPAFTIAHDSTLKAIAATQPRDTASLGEIRGVGPGFISKYAEGVLAIVASHTGGATFEPAT
jgi:ATP-dependent DNA helicase RecQ